ncbi:tetratricopeptide repeat protein [Nostoc sp.]|uniref:tetratricopeptide repeat protein n=1 Tax=Nostoc sp. TaxID=1180 RepID=UPI002FF9CD4F
MKKTESAKSNKKEIIIKLQWHEDKQNLQKTFEFRPEQIGDFIKIGREPNYECELRLEDNQVKWLHAKIIYENKNKNKFKLEYFKLKKYDDVQDDKYLENHCEVKIGNTNLKVVEISPKSTSDDKNNGKSKPFVSSLIFKRFFAFLIDFVIAFIGLFIILLLIILIAFLCEFFFRFSLRDDLNFQYSTWLVLFLCCILTFIYPTLFECNFNNKKQGLVDKRINLKIDHFHVGLGKHLLGIYITNSDGEPISVFRSILRCLFQPLLFPLYFYLFWHFIKEFLYIDSLDKFYVPLFFAGLILIFFVNLITLLFTKNQQSLRDWITKTKIVEKKEPIWLCSLFPKMGKGSIPNPTLVKVIVVIFVILLPTISAFRDPEKFYNNGNKKSLIGEKNEKNIDKKLKYEEAIADYDKAIDIKSDYADAYYKRGLAKSNLADDQDDQEAKKTYKNAIKDYDQAIKIKSKYADEAYYYRALAKHNLGDYKEAIEDYDQAIKNAPKYTDEAEAYYNRGLAKYNLEEAYYNRGLAKYNLGDNQRELAKYEEAKKSYENAIKDYDQAIKIKSKYADEAYYYYYRALAKHSSGDYKGAIEDYDQAIHFKSDYAYAYLNRGLVNSYLEHYENAIKDYDQAIHFKSDYADAYYYRALANSNLGDNQTTKANKQKANEYYNKANADYTKAIDFKSDYADAYNDRGNVMLQLGNNQKAKGDEQGANKYYNEAIADYTKAIEIAPKYAYPFNNRGLGKSSLKDYAAAIADYNEAIKIEPKYAYAYYNRGFDKSNSGQYQDENVLTDFNQAKMLYEQQGNESDPAYKDVLKQIERLSPKVRKNSK